MSLPNGPTLEPGLVIRNLQRQINLVDNVSLQKGPHNLKFGADFRRLSPLYAPFLYSQSVFMNDVPSAETGTLLGSRLQSLVGATVLLYNFSAFDGNLWLALGFGLCPVDIERPQLSSGDRL